MKTTADMILEGQKVSIVHEGNLLDISDALIKLIKKHYNNNILDNVPGECGSNYFSFEYPMDDFDGKIQAHVWSVYKDGCAEIHVIHDSIICNACDGDGRVEQWFEDDDIGDGFVDCKECEGAGEIDDNWEQICYDFGIDLPEEILYKTIDLNQGELF